MEEEKLDWQLIEREVLLIEESLNLYIETRIIIKLSNNNYAGFYTKIRE